MSVSLFAMRGEAPIRVGGELVSLNWHRDAALVVLGACGINDPAFVFAGELEVTRVARGLMLATEQRVTDALLDCERLTRHDVERRLADLRVFVARCIELKATHINFG